MIPLVKGRTKVAGGVLVFVAVGACAAVPLRTLDSPGAAVSAYAHSVSASSGGQVRLASARVTDQGSGRASYELQWHRPDRELVTIVVVQRRAFLGGLLSTWHVVEGGSAPAAALPGPRAN
jgi:hypothetical protein